MIRLQDYERVLLGQLNALSSDCMVDPPVFDWDGTVINFVDMLDFARNLIQMMERKLDAELRELASNPATFAARLPRLRSKERLNRLRESIGEIEVVARRLIRSPRLLQN